jgi:hypothetical protein
MIKLKSMMSKFSELPNSKIFQMKFFSNVKQCQTMSNNVKQCQIINILMHDKIYLNDFFASQITYKIIWDKFCY